MNDDDDDDSLEGCLFGPERPEGCWPRIFASASCFCFSFLWTAGPNGFEVAVFPFSSSASISKLAWKFEAVPVGPP